MPECLGDDGQVHVTGVGEACPAVPRRVGGERDVDAGEACDALEAAVVGAQERVETSACGIVVVGLPEDGEDIPVARSAVAGEDGSHARLDAHPDGAPRLAAAVHEGTAGDL